LFQPSPTYIFRPDTATFISQPGFNYTLTDNPNIYTAQNNNFSEQKYCDFVSICTSLKIQGKSSFCLNSSNTDSFKVVRNSTCLRKTSWTVDNSQMQILQSTDTSVKVKFLQPFKGYIKAAYENCSVADSLYIEVDTVYNIKSGVYLGNDTLQCLGKSITLNAGSGFKKYEWQDGSTLNTYTTADTGLFHIKVLDSCNTVFTDSVYILPNPKKLNISYSNPLCEYDTAKIILTGNLTNYSWQPLVGSSINGNTLLLFPTGTTIYTIFAQSHNTCFIEDTVLIKKKDCYGSMYFPTAFTPNNDGLNDIYKPKAVGILQSFSLTIYNRYGNLVFHTTDISIGWDGKYKNKTQTGGYTWVCTYTFRSRKMETESGSFVLLQ
jgi:gliding motility-associated-like protein